MSHSELEVFHDFLGDLSLKTHDTLQNIHDWTLRIKSRMDSIGTRINKLKAKKGCASEHLAKKSLGASLSLDKPQWENKPERTIFLFTPKTRTTAVKDAYAQCRPKPALHLLDEFRPNGASGAKLYSNPNHYYEDLEAANFTKTPSFAERDDAMRAHILKPENKESREFTSSRTLNRVSIDNLGIHDEPQTEQTQSSFESEEDEDDASEENIAIVKKNTIGKFESQPLESSHMEPAETLECITGSVVLATATVFDSPTLLPFINAENSKTPAPNQGFLNDIRNLQFKLRRVDQASRTPFKSKIQTGQDITAILLRRAALESDSDGNRSDDEEAWN